MNKSLERRDRINGKKYFDKRISSLIEKSFEYCVVESYKIFKETKSSGYDIDHLRWKFKNYFLKELNKYDNEFLYSEETDKLKEREYIESQINRFLKTVKV